MLRPVSLGLGLFLSAAALRAQRALPPLHAGDRVRIETPALGGRLEGYAYDLRADSLRIFVGAEQLSIRTIPNAASASAQAYRTVRSSRRKRALIGFLVGWLGTAVVGSALCGGDAACAEGAGYLSILTAPLAAGLAAIPPSEGWRDVDISKVQRPVPPAGAERPACCAGDSGTHVNVALGTPVRASFTATSSDETLHWPTSLFLHVDEPVIVDGHVVVDRGTLLRAPVLRVKGPGTYGRPGTIEALLAAVTTVDGQELMLGTVFTQRGNDLRAAGTLLGLGLMRGGHAIIPVGTQVTAFTSELLRARVR